MNCQIEVFVDEKSALEEIKDEVKIVKESSDKVRKSLFARHAALAKSYAELSERLQIIERNICQSSGATMSLRS